MKLVTTKEKILNAALLAERIAGKRESLPILSCVLLDADKGLTIRSTNLEAAIEVHVVGEVEEKGMLAVPANIFSQTLRSIGSDKITLKSDGPNLLVESRGTKTLIKAVPHDEFPTLSSAQSGKGQKISREHFLKGIQSVMYAASTSMVRPELGSIHVSREGEKIMFVATDSFRLAEKTVSAARAVEAHDFLIPVKHAGELVYILERLSDDDIEIGAAESDLTLIAGNVKFSSRLVDGVFPNYHEIVPKAFVTEATVLKNDFAEMLRKARVFSGNEQHIGLHLYPKRKIFSATAQSPDVGEMSDSIDAAIEGEDVDINFHVSYLADCLPSIEADSITLSFAQPGKPLVIRGVSEGSFKYLVMPLNR